MFPPKFSTPPATVREPLPSEPLVPTFTVPLLICIELASVALLFCVKVNEPLPCVSLVIIVVPETPVTVLVIVMSWPWLSIRNVPDSTLMGLPIVAEPLVPWNVIAAVFPEPGSA